MRKVMRSLEDQMADHRINSDVHLAMKADRADLIAGVKQMLDKANAEYNHAAAMHFTSKCSYYGGQVDALKKVLEIL